MISINNQEVLIHIYYNWPFIPSQGLFIHFLKNENFKQNLAKCSSHSKVSLALESLLGSDQVTLEDLILLGSSLCKQLFYSDLLEKLILLLFQKHLSDKKTVEFLKMVWFDKGK